MYPLKAEKERGFAQFGGLYGRSKVSTICTLVETAFRGEPSLGEVDEEDEEDEEVKDVYG